MAFDFPTNFREAIKPRKSGWLIRNMCMNPNQARVSHFLLQSLPSIHLPSRVIPESGHRSSWPFGRDRPGSGAHPQPGPPWRRRAQPRGGGRPSPRLLSTASPGSLETERTSHAGEAAPRLLARLPSVPSARLLTWTAGESAELGDAPSRENTAASVSSSPPRKQIPELSGNNQRVPSLTPDSTTVFGNLLNLLSREC